MFIPASNALRKRSSSLSNLEQLLTDKVVDNSPPKVSQSVKKVKLPNFAAIHKKRFEKMESLDDYVQRRQERADNWAKVAKSIKKTLSIKKGILALFKISVHYSFVFIYRNIEWCQRDEGKSKIEINCQ